MIKKYLVEEKNNQKQILLQMEKEIKILEFKIKHTNLINTGIKTVKNLKITARAVQLISPYVLTAGITAGSLGLLGNMPFHPNDEWKIYSNVMTEFDNTGNIRHKRQYEKFEDNNGDVLDGSDNLLYYYPKWLKNEDGLYYRTVQIYSIKNKTYENIIGLFDKENLNLKDIFGEPNSNIKETKADLTEDELQEEPVIKAVVYDIDENDYIIHKETKKENIKSSCLYVLLTAFLEVVLLCFKNESSSFNFSKCIDHIKRKYQPLDIDIVTKKLELKKNNYNRMVR